MDKLTEFVSKSFDPNKSALSVHYLAQSAARTESFIDSFHSDSRSNNNDMADYRLDENRFPRVTTNTSSDCITDLSSKRSPEYHNEDSHHTTELKREPPSSILTPGGSFDFHRLSTLSSLSGLPGVLPPHAHLPYPLPLLLSHHHHLLSTKRLSSSPPPHLDNNNAAAPSPYSHQFSPKSSPPPLSNPRQMPYPPLGPGQRHIRLSSPTSPPRPLFHQTGSTSPPSRNSSPFQPRPPYEEEDIDVDIEAPASPVEGEDDRKNVEDRPGNDKAALKIECEGKYWNAFQCF